RRRPRALPGRRRPAQRHRVENLTLNGGWRLSFNFGWGPVRQESRIMQNPGPHTVDGLRAIHYDQVQWHLPLNTMQQLHHDAERPSHIVLPVIPARPR
ncbi:MAG TPA: hypothetical protein VLI67_12340, partial [Vicinamibacteria bacterium]|nr:hypothetical protein [Vicinamibacteria bacterium]